MDFTEFRKLPGENDLAFFERQMDAAAQRTLALVFRPAPYFHGWRPEDQAEALRCAVAKNARLAVTYARLAALARSEKPNRPRSSARRSNLARRTDA